MATRSRQQTRRGFPENACNPCACVPWSWTSVNVTNSAKFDHGCAPSRLRCKNCSSRTVCFGRHAFVLRDCIIFYATITNLEHWRKTTMDLSHWGDRFVFYQISNIMYHDSFSKKVRCGGWRKTKWVILVGLAVSSRGCILFMELFPKRYILWLKIQLYLQLLQVAFGIIDSV
jgi:hypothetical protein